MDRNFSALRHNAALALRRLTLFRPAEERCELCRRVLAPDHRHLFEVSSRGIVCACNGCALRFVGVIGARFKLIPRDARPLPAFCMNDELWSGLALPSPVAFFFEHSPDGRIFAVSPGPSGLTESLISLETWNALVEANPVLARIEPDIEALLVNRVGRARDYFIAPIDRCYELAAWVRKHWPGLAEGDTFSTQMEDFFSRLREPSGPHQLLAPLGEGDRTSGRFEYERHHSNS
jgi:hypothetical protein